jgi:two-component system OmpR family sensor kinase
MPLRTRLLLAIIGVVVAGLVISDVVTYSLLRTYLQNRIDPQLVIVSSFVETSKGLGPKVSHGFTPPPGSTLVPKVSGPLGSNGIVPDGTLGALITSDGRTKGNIISFSFSNKKLIPPRLPHPLPTLSSSGTAVFDADSSGPDPISYRVLIRSVPGHHEYAMVAIPLTEVNITLDDLRLIMLLVSAGVLAGLGVMSWWILRRGFRPLEDIARTAGEIAQGDLGRRIDQSDSRTEVGRLGLALNAMLGDIEAAMTQRARAEARLRRFLADASHELRTPLTSIRGYAEMFDRGACDRPADLAISMHHIRHEADRMNVLVDELLLLARLDQKRPLRLETIDVVHVVRTAVSAARVGSKSHPVVLDVSQSVELRCDGERLRQVLDNLLTNALNHSPSDAAVNVRVRRMDGGQVRIEVADHGPGIAPEDADRVFEPFFRTDLARVRDTGGTGLGLSIVASIAQAHGGVAGVDANDGGGALFWVEFPADVDAPMA